MRIVTFFKNLNVYTDISYISVPLPTNHEQWWSVTVSIKH